MSGARALSLFEGKAEQGEEAGRWVVTLRWAPRRTRQRRQPIHELIVLEVPPPMNLEGVPPSVAATLQHIVAQLDALVTVVGGLDLRLRDVEERVAGAAGGGGAGV